MTNRILVLILILLGKEVVVVNKIRVEILMILIEIIEMIEMIVVQGVIGMSVVVMIEIIHPPLVLIQEILTITTEIAEVIERDKFNNPKKYGVNQKMLNQSNKNQRMNI